MTYDEMVEQGVTEAEIQAGEMANVMEYETPVEPAFREYARDPELIEYNCTKCQDEGIIEAWGPNDRCKEFMTEPEHTEICKCEAGIKYQAELDEYADRAAMQQELEYERRYNESAGYEIRL